MTASATLNSVWALAMSWVSPAGLIRRSAGTNTGTNGMQATTPATLKRRLPTATRRVSTLGNPTISAVTPIPRLAPNTTATAPWIGKIPCAHKASPMPMVAVGLCRIKSSADANKTNQTG